MKIDQKNINTLNNKGVAYNNLNEYLKAIDCYDQTLKIDPKNIDALNNMGEAYYNLNEL